MTARRTLVRAADFVAAGLVRPEAADAVAAVGTRHAMAMTPEMVALVQGEAAHDPIARQFVPDPLELHQQPGERLDPIGDRAHAPMPGLVHRYPDRVLLKVTAACPVYCRFCFRREMVGPTGGDEAVDAAGLAAALAYVAGHPGIREVILTGGDPFMLSPRRALALTGALAGIPHLDVIRWHTRVPTVDPGRVDDALVAAIATPQKAVFVAVHANHPREFTPQAAAALSRLAKAGIALVSQSVLLRGVNDSVETLEDLMRAFVRHRVKPYYLHHPDPAPGTGHFRLSVQEGQALMRALHARLSGLAMPTYVLDIPGGVSKAPLGPAYFDADRLAAWGADGRWHDLPETMVKPV